MQIIHHNDFDGMASAGIFANFLDFSKVEDPHLMFHAIDYNSINDYYAMDFENSSCVLDFPFNPTVKWWFDHHKTSFKDDSYRKLYKPSPFRYWNTRAKSCPALLFGFFKKNYPKYYLEMNKTYSKLVQYSSTIDSAQYRDPKQIYDFDDPYISFNHILNHLYSADIVNQFILAVRSTKLAEFFESRTFADAQEKIVDIYAKYAHHFEKSTKTNNKVIELNFIEAGLRGDRYLGYLYNPNADFTITIDRKNSHFYIGVGYNPWKKENWINIGAYLKKFGGGGRMNVGAVLFDTKEALEEALTKIRSKLQE